jgi:hypothetical protein
MMVVSGSCQESKPLTQEREKQMRRKRYRKAICKFGSKGMIACGLLVIGKTAAGEFVERTVNEAIESQFASLDVPTTSELVM